MKFLILIGLCSLILLNGCDDVINGYEQCKRDCIDIQCYELNEDCSWYNYNQWVTKESGNQNTRHNITYEQTIEIKKVCLEECNGDA